MPVSAKLTESSRGDGGEIVKVMVDSSPSFVMSAGEAETLTDCACNKDALKKIPTPIKTNPRRIDRVFMIFNFTEKTSPSEEDSYGLWSYIASTSRSDFSFGKTQSSIWFIR